MKLKNRLIIGFALISMLMVVSVIFSYINVTNIKSQIDRVDQVNIKKLNITNEVSKSVQNIFRTIVIISSLHDVETKTKQFEYIQAQRVLYRKNIDELQKLEITTEGKQLIDSFISNIKYMSVIDDKIIELSNEGKHDELDALVLNSFIPNIYKFLDATENLENYQEGRVKFRFIEMIHECNIVLMSSIILLALSIIVSAICAWYITSTILKQLGADPSDVVTSTKRVSSGDLTEIIRIEKLDENSVMYNLSDMTRNIKKMISDVIDISNIVASASIQLQTVSEQISVGAEESANQANTVATSSEELSNTASDIAKNCQYADENSDKASLLVQDGNNIVIKTIHNITLSGEQTKENSILITELGKQGEQIGTIVGTIEDIADQTNLLALNAAIEAARAGEQGRGFAVVADEVRALASRTATATKEITEMVKNIQMGTNKAIQSLDKSVVSSVKNVEEAQELDTSLSIIKKQIGEVLTQISQISVAAEEQTAVTNEVTSNIQQISEASHITAKGAEEIVMASSQLSKQAKSLQDTISLFKI